MIAAVTFLADYAFAQQKPWSKLFTVDGAYAAVMGKETNNSLDGYSVGLSVEQLSRDGQWSAGIGLMYLNSQDTNAETQEEINYTSFPITLLGKYYFGTPEFSGYFQGGFGIQFSKADYTNTGNYISGGRDSGLTFNLGAGMNLFLNEKMFLNFGYNLMLMNNSFFQDGMAHLFKLGLGFQY
jgi:hypothetical protein